MNVTLEEFIEAEKDRLDEFKESWERDNSVNPDHYPMTMPDGEWDQQLLSYNT